MQRIDLQPNTPPFAGPEDLSTRVFRAILEHLETEANIVIAQDTQLQNGIYLCCAINPTAPELDGIAAYCTKPFDETGKIEDGHQLKNGRLIASSIQALVDSIFKSPQNAWEHNFVQVGIEGGGMNLRGTPVRGIYFSIYSQKIYNEVTKQVRE